jgi:hypothetical protein
MSRPSTTNLYPPSTSYATFGGGTHGAPNTRTLTLWIHDPDASGSLSKHETVLNYDLFPPGVAKPGDVAEVRLVPQATSASTNNLPAEGYSTGNGNGHASDNGSGSLLADRRPVRRKGSYTGSMIEEERPKNDLSTTQEEPIFLFVIRELEESQRKLNVQVFSSSIVALTEFHS